MEIMRDKLNKRLWLSHSKFVNFVLQHFCMVDCKPLSVPLSVGTKLSVEQCPTTPTEMEDMNFFPYASETGILMYVMICTRLGISQVVGILS